MSKVEERLSAIGITVPDAAAPAANYVPYTISGNQIFVAGQIPMVAGEIKHQAKVGDDMTADQAVEVAKVCAINIIAQVKSAIGDLDRVTKIVRLGGFVNATPDFGDHPKVINGASDLMVEAFGKDVGAHSRAAVGAGSLPFGVAVEIDAIVEFK
ncbi:MAG: RidA family protein [Alphaproteobacteria bacterium]